MATHQAILTPEAVMEQFRKNGVTHAVYLPDSETNWMFQLMEAEPGLDLIPVCREGETMAIAAGLIIGGKKPVCIIQNTGMYESGDSIRGMALDLQMPMVIMVGYRGYTRHGRSADSAGLYTEPFLNTWGLHYYLVENDGDADRISLAFADAEKAKRPVAVLVGDEYHGFNR